MYTEGAPEFVVDQGMYYPAAINYGYYCTGFESPSEFENHQMMLSVDDSDIQYPSGQNENSPYICYTPSYGYAQSPYNPYNPYIPGASIGAEAPFIGSQQYYPIPPYMNDLPSPTYAPYVIQPDVASNGSTEASLETGAAINGRSDGRGSKHKSVSATSGLSKTTQRPSMPNASQRPSTAGFSTPASTHPVQGVVASVNSQSIDHVSNDGLLSMRNGFPSIASNNYKLRPKFYSGRGGINANGNQDANIEQNRGPRTKRSTSQLIIKAYTTKAGNADAEGNIVIHTDQYNKESFNINYEYAKFFVIKSYSEDDVHKSIKYSVWSSTQHGNKKLQSAYEDAQRIATEMSCECPVFLFFSVNASGLFCGVAEMTGPVAFDKDMDFWQQDKWSGSFPVQWHIIKDVPNGYFRHVILQNNENKPVTNSRDTQEIILNQGLEMLKIFKDHAEKTSLLDDFMYYESRQRMMQEEKNRFLYGTFRNHFPGPNPVNADREKNIAALGLHIDKGVKYEKGVEEAKEDCASALKIGSLTINANGANSKPTTVAALNHAEPMSKPTPCPNSDHSRSDDASPPDDDIVRVGSMPIKVKGSANSLSKILMVGSIPLDPRSVKK